MEKKKKDRKKRNPASRLLHRLIEARWFFAMSASVVATVIGISLTFGINSCRENRKARHEIQKSMLQAIDNLSERFEDVEKWVARLENQNRIYNISDSLFTEGKELPDSLCEEFRYTLPYIRLTAFDHEFEKIFRGSYQLWQLQNSGDSLAYYIGLCYDGLNTVENTCQELSEGMLEQIGVINADRHFYRMPPKEWTLTLLSDANFQYFMSIRKVKTDIAAAILQQARQDYEDNVVRMGNKLRE